MYEIFFTDFYTFPRGVYFVLINYRSDQLIIDLYRVLMTFLAKDTKHSLFLILPD